MASLPLDAIDSGALPDGWMYADLDASDILLDYAQVLQPPYVVAGVGLAIGILCGLTFAKLVENKLEGWKQDRLPLLPLGSFSITLPYFGVVIGITLFIGGSLQVFGFSAGVALLVSFVLSVATAGALWVLVLSLKSVVK